MQHSKSHSNNFLTLYGVFVFFLVGLFPYQLSAQFNLVPNPSFEQYTNCPAISLTDINVIKNNKPDFWYKPDLKGAIYLNSCAHNDTLGVPYNRPNPQGDLGYQVPRTGNAYITMFYRNGITNARNYFQIKLIDSLVANRCYFFSCFVNRCNGHQLACNNQAILLTKIPIYADTAAIPPQYIIPANPQVNNTIMTISDSTNWVKISGVVVAQGGEQYLTIGNFKYDSQTTITTVQSTGYYGAAYYVDDVSVIPLDSMPLKADAGLDTTIAIGDSAFVGSLTNGIPNITWYNSSGAVIKTGVPGFYVQPTTTTWYVIEQSVCGYASRDTVTVTVNLLPLHWLGFTALTSPQPLSQGEGQAKICVSLRWQTANEVKVSHYNIQRSVPGREFVNIGEVKANNKAYNEYSYVDLAPLSLGEGSGVRFYRIQSIDKDGMRSYSAVRSVIINSQHLALSIYPNPAKGFVCIEYPHLKQITIIDAMGRVVLNKQAAGNKTTLTVNGLPKGLYLLRIMNEENNSETSKFVIE